MFALPAGFAVAKVKTVLVGLGVVATVATIAGVGYAAWHVRGIKAENDQRKAVDKAVSTAVEAIQQQLDEERKLRIVVQTQMNQRLDRILKSISNIEVKHTTITNNITQEREVHKEFYVQELPPGGYEQLKRARELVTGSQEPRPQ